MRRDTVISSAVGADRPTPASVREYLRGSLPAVYCEPPSQTTAEPFAMRLLHGLEEVLDPAVATIDMLAAHLDVRLAPPEVIRLVGEWLGIEFDAALPIGVHRRLLRHAAEIARTRGTLFGVWLVLELSFPKLEFELSDGGGATISLDPGASRPAGEPALRIQCPPRLDQDYVAAVRRVVEEVIPVDVRLDLVTAEGELA